MSISLYAYGDRKKVEVIILIKEMSYNINEIYAVYAAELRKFGLTDDQIGIATLTYNDENKAPASLQKACLDKLIQSISAFNGKILLVADSNYFKTLTKRSKVDNSYGYVCNCQYKGFEDYVAILSINYGALFHNPKLKERIILSAKTTRDYLQDMYVEPGKNIIKYQGYPETLEHINIWLQKLEKYSALTCDIETFSLKVHEAKIATISFAWNQHEGIAFKVAYNHANNIYSTRNMLKAILRSFFESYKGKIIYHGGTFDIKVIIYELFMKDSQDTEGLLEGLEIMTRNIDDTKLISYLATNSTAGNRLGLKQQALDFAGDYAQDDIKDITRISTPDLLKYNLVDCLSTWYTYNKNYPIMVADDQEDIYQEIFLPSMKIIIQMELTGMPIDIDEVQHAKTELLNIKDRHMKTITESPLIQEFENILRTEALIDKNAKLKKKVMHAEDFLDVKYNPSSNHQTRHLLYDIFGYPIIDTTDSGAGAVGAATLKKMLVNLQSEFGIADEELE